MHEALSEAKRQLGDNVAVLHTRHYDDPIWLGLRRDRGVEVLAAVDTAALGAPSKTVTHSSNGEDFDKVCRELSELRQVLVKLESSKGSDEKTIRSPAVDRLIRHGVSEKLAESLLQSAGDAQDKHIILYSIEQRIRCSGPINCENGQARVTLIGPTGAGKTTTAAKLAAQYLLVQKKKVALLTMDTYRVGAVEQLAAYARILNVPLEVAFSPADVDALVAKHSDKDLIVMDTVGRSQRNREQLSELGAMLRSARPTEVHLVISASYSAVVQRESVDSFGMLAANRLILTKLDECPQAGCVLELAAAGLIPFSYITYGQEVPDDISVAERSKLADLVWEGTM